MNLFVLKAVLGLDDEEYRRKIDEDGKKASVFGDVLKANLVTKGVEVAAAGMKKLASATVSMVQQSIDAFADYEQLVGGVETLFKDSADTVKQYADEAYKTAGLSANEYMETVTSFSASLIQSLGGDTRQAAELADMAITDMADNANKMGTDMASIQNAYQGFAKQNYTMLDNLKLGYGGTKSEMDRLIKDAMKLDKTFKVTTKTGKKGNQEIEYSYADIVKAIHIVQDEMDITGTTAKEAEGTISGSLATVKSAWQNLLTGLGEGDEKKIGKLIDNLVDSAEKYIDNVIPVIERILDGIATLIEKIAPKIAERLPTILNNILPKLLNAGLTIIKALGTALLDNRQVILDALGELLLMIVNAIAGWWNKITAKGKEIVKWLWDGIKANAKDIYDKVVNWINDNIVQPIKNAYEAIKQAGKELINKFWDGIANGWKEKESWFWSLIESLPGGHNLKMLRSTYIDNGAQSNVVSNDAVGNAAGYEYSIPRQSATNNADRPIYLTLDGQVFARLFAPYMDGEQQRIGVRLATGGAL